MTIVMTAERTFSRGKKPGPATATFESFEQKQKLMKSKHMLKNIEPYTKMYVENDYAPEVRNADINLRTILKEIGSHKQYRVVGDRVLPMKQENSTGNSA